MEIIKKNRKFYTNLQLFLNSENDWLKFQLRKLKKNQNQIKNPNFPNLNSFNSVYFLIFVLEDPEHLVFNIILE